MMPTLRSAAFLLFGFSLAMTAQEPLRLQAGPLKLDVHISRTAELFHVMDQLSGWSPYCHRQYKHAMGPLSAAEEALLARHRAVRAKRDWGEGLEQTFNTELDLEPALARGVHEGWLTKEQADTEREVLTGFAPRVDPLIEAERPRLLAFRERLRKELAPMAARATQMARFMGTQPAPVPVFLVADPDPANYGGGFNGGLLVLEIPREADPYPIFQHEVFHAFLEPRRAMLDKAVEGVTGLESQTLDEGLAYAFAPGLVAPAGQDQLLDFARRDLADGKKLDDDYTRFHFYALALRPLLLDALEDNHQTLDTFLPRALDTWRVLQALESRRDAPAPGH